MAEMEVKHDNDMTKLQSEHVKGTALLKQDLANTIKILKVHAAIILLFIHLIYYCIIAK